MIASAMSARDKSSRYAQSREASAHPAAEKSTFAIGLFTNLERIGAARGALAKSGVDETQMALVTGARFDTVQSQVTIDAPASEPEQSRLQNLVQDFLALPSPKTYAGALWLLQTATLQLEASAAQAADTARASIAVAQTRPDFARLSTISGGGLTDRVLLRQAQCLQDHLRGGGDVLVVRVESDAQQRAVCTALLEHATKGVQTHEISAG